MEKLNKGIYHIHCSIQQASKWNPSETDPVFRQFLMVMEKRKEYAELILKGKNIKSEDAIDIFELYNKNVKQILGI